MNAARLKQLEALFDEARSLSASERRGFASRVCGSDSELRSELLTLLAADDLPDAPLDNPLLGSDIAQAALDVSLPPPPRIGAYRILRLLGEGGMGLVYEAEQDNPRRKIALKLLRPGLATGAALRRFEQEAQLLGRLRHPGIAQIYEAGAALIDMNGVPARQPFLAMELVDGAPVTTFASKNRLSVPERLALVADACDAVHHAHQRGVIHRDLKPENILVSFEATESRSQVGEATTPGQRTFVAPSNRGAVASPKILDFGIARVLDADFAARSMHTAPGQIIGTLPYMSPEQIGGDTGDLDVRTDVYSMGIVLYELVVGRTPHAAATAAEVVQRIANVEAPRPGSIHRALRGDLETIVLKAIEKDRSRRYSSIAEFGSDLRRFLANEPIAARRSSTWYLVRKLVARHRLAAIGGMLFLVTVIGSAIALGTLYRDQLVQRQRADDQARLAREESARAERFAADAREKFLLARGSVEFLMEEVSTRLRRLLGTSQIRKDILRQAYDRLVPLLEEAGDDPDLQHQLARLHGKLGNAALDLGDTAAAAEQLSTARDIFERLSTEQPDDPRLAASVADAYRALGDLAWRFGDLNLMAAYYARQLEICERIFAADPDSPQSIRTLSLAYERMAIGARATDNAAEDRLWSTRMHELKQILVARQPDDPELQYELSVAEERLADCARIANELDAAERHAHASRELRECLITAHPDNPTYLRALSISFERLAMLAARRKDPAANRAWTKQMHELKLRLVTLEPGNPLYQHDLAICLDRLARQAANDQRFDEAEANWAAAQAIFERLAQAEPNAPRFREDVREGERLRGLIEKLRHEARNPGGIAER